MELGLQHWLDITDGQWDQILDVCRGNLLKPPEKRDPRKYQGLAIEKAKEHFLKKNNKRGKLIMPCATGKSLIAYWVTQELNVRSIIVAVPSLALVKQSLKDWTSEYLAEGIFPEWIAVCSDDSVGQMKEADSTVATVYESGIPTTTDPTDIAKFLKKKSKNPKVIFTTYQSSHQLADACRKANLTIDLLIADEAHKTVGRRNKKFATLLFDENIRIKKRLFMTATERVYRQGTENVVSMNDESIYGQVFHEMTFAQAIAGKIICDYKILTIAVSEAEVANLIREHTEVNALLGNQKVETDAHTLAAGIAIEKSFQKHGIKHAISFHRSIKRAEDFSSQQAAFSGKLGSKLDVENRNISSKLSAGQRSQVLKNFIKDNRSLVTNARCLTEGVDIPAIDCVAFVDPKQSRVDIVQAAGRAMRNSEETGKILGYIILPIIVPEAQNLNEFAETTDFAAVARVITTLSTQDERIVAQFRHREPSQRNNRDDVVIIDPDIIEALDINYENFYDTISTRIWQSVGRANWRPFEEAKRFVHTLGFNGQSAWYEYAGSPECPPDIPSSCSTVYGSEWTTWGDWLGTGTIATRLRIFRSYEEATNFVHPLKLKNFNPEWINYCTGKRDDLPIKPDDIPSNPDRTYSEFKKRGAWGGWLGTGTIATHLRPHVSYEEAKEFVHGLGLKSERGGRKQNNLDLSWRNYKAGNLVATLGEIPKYIPSSPEKVYGDEFDWPDFLGNGGKPKDVDYWTYSQARDWVIQLELHKKRIVRTEGKRKNAARNKWNDFCAGLYPDLPVKPVEIPSSIHHGYKDKGYKGYRHFITPG